MARAKTAPKKTVSKKQTATRDALKRQLTYYSKLWLFVIGFGFVGSFLLMRSDASSALPTYSDDIVAGYVNMTPTIISRDEAGNTAYEMYSASTYVQLDGTIVCDAGGATGAVTTGTLSNGEVRKLHKDLDATGVTQLADEVGFNSGDSFVAFEGLMVSQGAEAKGTAVYSGQRPADFSRAKDTLQRHCAKATRTVERAQIRAPREPKLKKTEKKSAFTRAIDSLFTKVSACCSAGPRDTAFEDQHAASINSWRQQNGRAMLAHTQCLKDKAVNWSNKMANDGYLSHSPYIGADTQACHSNWRKAGENVGAGYDNAGLMQKFKESPAHNANMLDPAFRAFGVGALRSNRDGRIYVTQRYAAY